MQKISKKSADELYDNVHKAVMDARIELSKLTIMDGSIRSKIDEIMFRLSLSAPEAALKSFNNLK